MFDGEDVRLRRELGKSIVSIGNNEVLAPDDWLLLEAAAPDVESMLFGCDVLFVRAYFWVKTFV